MFLFNYIVEPCYKDVIYIEPNTSFIRKMSHVIEEKQPSVTFRNILVL